MQLRKTVVTLASVIVAAGMLSMGLQAQAAKNWKDRAEYDLYDAITKDNNLATRLANLDKWKTNYAASEYADVRQRIYLVTYQGMNNHRAAFDMATEILKADPNDQTSLQEILGFVRALVPQDPKAALSAQNKADLETAEKAAHYVITNADSVYGAAKKPAGVADDVWAKTKPTMTNFAQFTLGWIGATQKDTGKAEAELIKTLQADPTNAQASYMLASNLLSQQKDHPEKVPFALFEYARSAVYDGPGALDAKARPGIDAFFAKAYAGYHGSAEGADAVKTLAKTNALPPSDFMLESVIDIAKKKEADRLKFAEGNPGLAFWTENKERLVGEGGAAYWEMMKGLALPGPTVPGGKFKGKLISASPETKPKELKIAIEKDGVADVTLKLTEPLPGMMEPGGEISFSGVAAEYSKEPYMITFEVEREDVEGWTGKGPVTPARPRPAAKKAAPAAGKK